MNSNEKVTGFDHDCSLHAAAASMYRPDKPFSHTTPPEPKDETTAFPTVASLASRMTQARLGLPSAGVTPSRVLAVAPEAKSDSTPYTKAHFYGSEAHFNGLTPGEAERLALLAEEAGEVVRAVGKILRHGYSSFNPDKEGHLGNRGELELEIGDFAGVIDLMIDAGDINEDRLLTQAEAKRPRMMKYAHHQEGL